MNTPEGGLILANHKSALKRHRQSLKLRAKNRVYRTRVKNMIKAVHEAVTANDQDKAQEALRVAASMLDKAATKGVIHRRNAARRISRLSLTVNKIGSAAA